MNYDGDAYFLMRGRVCCTYEDALSLPAPLRWVYMVQLQKDLEAERASLRPKD